MYFLLIDLAIYININLQIRYSGATIKNLTFQKPSGIKGNAKRKRYSLHLIFK